jgi:hypothetical protein
MEKDDDDDDGDDDDDAEEGNAYLLGSLTLQ